MTRWLASPLAAAALLFSPGTGAFFHTYQVDQVYSNASGTIQFVTLITNLNGENLSAGEPFTARDLAGNVTGNFTFPSNLPSANTAGRHVLIATESFKALGLVTPDFTIPDHFVPTGGGSVGTRFSTMSYGAGQLPLDGVNALYRTGPGMNLATNFAGQSASVSAPPPILNFQGIWWAAPAGSESGWGLNLAHQGETIFASWFTYDPQGRAWWLVMTATKTGANQYQGQLFETTGPAFDATPWLPANVVATPVGTGTLTFTDADHGTFQYTVNKGASVTQTKTLVRQVFGPLPTCVWGAQPNLALATNFQDLWWKAPANTESGWGINFNHEGDTIFATWFTYNRDGTPLWLVVTANRTAPGVYTGDLFQTSGPPFSAVPFNPAMVVSTKVGTATFTFADGNNATFSYTVQVAGMTTPSTQSKAVTRQIFAPPGTVCN